MAGRLRLKGMDAVGTWTRYTSWRQGHVLPAEAVRILGISNSDALENTCVVVIGHDCDLANDDLEAVLSR